MFVTLFNLLFENGFSIFSDINFLSSIIYFVITLICIAYILWSVQQVENLFSKNFISVNFLSVLNNVKRFYLIIGSIFILSALTGSIASGYILHGDISIEMNDIYNNQNKQIPIEIRVTGAQTDSLVVDLYKTDLKNHLLPMDSIELRHTPYNENNDKVFSSIYLTGNNLNKGEYKVYINSTNFTEGYYELSFTVGENMPLYYKLFLNKGITKSIIKRKTNSFYLIATK